MTAFGSFRGLWGLLACVLITLALAAVPASAATPVAETGPATSLTATTATLNGTVITGNVATGWEFQFGTTTAYGSTTSFQTLPPSTTPTSVTATLTALAPGTTYHYRLVILQASAPYETPEFGEDLTFSTPDSAGSTGPSGVPGVAVTEPATGILGTTATLNAVVNTQGIDSLWVFEYGTTTAYGQTTAPQALKGKSVPNAVSAGLTGLRAGSTYHFKIVVLQGSYIPTVSTGGDATLKTLTPAQAAKFGVASLNSKRLSVKHGSSALISMHCRGAGGAKCNGRLSISARGKLGARTRTVGCGSGRFVANAGHTHIVRGTLSAGCATLVRRARQHKLRATLIATFTTHQARLRASVTLVG